MLFNLFRFSRHQYFEVFPSGADYYIDMIGIDFHYRNIKQDVISFRDLVYFYQCDRIFFNAYRNNLFKK